MTWWRSEAANHREQQFFNRGTWAKYPDKPNGTTSLEETYESWFTSVRQQQRLVDDFEQDVKSGQRSTKAFASTGYASGAGADAGAGAGGLFQWAAGMGAGAASLMGSMGLKAEAAAAQRSFLP